MITKITDEEIERARIVLKSHTVKPLTREGALESGIFCIASQATPFEIASRLIYGLRRESHPNDLSFKQRFATLEVLTTKDVVNRVAHEGGYRFAYAKRFDSLINNFGEREDEWWLGVRDADYEERKGLIKRLKWLSNKTLDFWMLCLGRDSIALDVHVMRYLSTLGIEINPNFYTPVARSKDKQKVRRTPNRIEYELIERDARQLFSQDSRFLKKGEVDMALVDALLWWNGATNGPRRDHPNQSYLFTPDLSDLVLPYAGTIRTD